MRPKVTYSLVAGQRSPPPYGVIVTQVTPVGPYSQSHGVQSIAQTLGLIRDRIRCKKCDSQYFQSLRQRCHRPAVVHNRRRRVPLSGTPDFSRANDFPAAVRQCWDDKQRPASWLEFTNDVVPVNSVARQSGRSPGHSNSPTCRSLAGTRFRSARRGSACAVAWRGALGGGLQ